MLSRFVAPAAAPIFLNVGIIGSAFVISPILKSDYRYWNRSSFGRNYTNISAIPYKGGPVN